MFIFSRTSKKVKSSLLPLIRLYSCVGENVKSLEKITDFPEAETKLLKVGIIGMPNAGKSTFINNLMDRTVCPTSSKVHTTRSRSSAIFTEGNSQIVFLDTPGLVGEKELNRYHLEKTFKRDTEKVLKNADIVGVIHDVSNINTREYLDIKIIKLLEYHSTKPSFLVFNKVDILKSKRKLLDLTRSLTDNSIDGKPISGTFRPKPNTNRYVKTWPNFREIFMVSALTGDGLSDIKQFLINNAKPGKWMYPEGVWTDQNAEHIIVKLVYAKLLDFLPQEIPYTLKPEMEYFEIIEGIINCAVIVHCPSVRIAKLIAGVSDGKLRQIIQSVQDDLQHSFQNVVRIRIALSPSYK